jgi:hypothetical protein
MVSSFKLIFIALTAAGALIVGCEEGQDSDLSGAFETPVAGAAAFSAQAVATSQEQSGTSALTQATGTPEAGQTATPEADDDGDVDATATPRAGDTDADATATPRAGDTDDGDDDGDVDTDSRESRISTDENFSTDFVLDSAQIREFNLDDDEEEFVEFTFSGSVQTIEDEGGFFVAGFDPEVRVDATTVEIVEDDDNVVLVGFESGTDLSQFSVARVDASVVMNVADEVNLPDTEALDGADPSFTSAPVLEDVEDIDETLNRATLVFNEDLDEDTAGDASAFVYYTESGIEHEASEVISIEDDRVIVEWDDADEVEDGVRFGVDEDAVQDRQGIGNLVGAIGDTTAAPDLTDASQESEGLWRFEFDESVTPEEPSQFFLFAQNGEKFEGTDFTVEDDDTVLVAFPQVEDFADQVTYAAVGRDAVRSITADSVENTVGATEIDADIDVEAGATAGPDLIDAEIDEDAGLVEFTFDQRIDDDEDVDADRFFIVTEAGELAEGRAVSSVDDDHVIVLFDETLLEAAAAAGVLDDAVGDEQGLSNLVRTIVTGGGGEADLGDSEADEAEAEEAESEETEAEEAEAAG